MWHDEEMHGDAEHQVQGAYQVQGYFGVLERRGGLAQTGEGSGRSFKRVPKFWDLNLSSGFMDGHCSILYTFLCNCEIFQNKLKNLKLKNTSGKLVWFL